MENGRTIYVNGGDHFSDVRNNAIDAAKKAGVVDQKELNRLGEEAAKKEMFRIGRETEHRFTSLLMGFDDIIDHCATSSHADDIEHGVDLWITFNEETGLPCLPVQIKSSYRMVKEFTKSDEFLAANEAILVVNAGPSVSDETIREQVDKEVRRIRDLFHSNPDHAVLIPIRDQYSKSK